MPMPIAFSFWELEALLPKAEIAIVGAGLVGISAALALKQMAPKRRIVVLERGPWSMGASTRNAGFACFGSPSELLHDQAVMGEEALWELVAMRWNGLQQLRRQLGDKAIDYQPTGGTEIFRVTDEDSFHQCMAALPELNRRVAAVTGDQEAFRILSGAHSFSGVAHRIENQLEGQLHPGKMMRALYQQAHDLCIPILFGIAVAHIQETAGGVSLHLEQGGYYEVDQLILANNGLARQLLPALDVASVRNQVLVTAPLERLPFRGCFHCDQGYLYFRNIGPDRILLGGARNWDPQGETTAFFGPNPTVRAYLKQFLHEVIMPDQPVEIEHWWSGLLGIGGKKSPVLEQYSDRITVAVRLGGMGVAIGTELGRRAAELCQANEALK